jgi:integrase/recombinase XerD
MTNARTALLLDQWPLGDQSLWNTANITGAFLEADGPAAHWKDKTRKGVIKRYGLWLGFLRSIDKLVLERRPSVRMTEEYLVSYVEWLRDRGNASTTTTSCIRDLREAIRVMEPAADLELLSELTATLHARQSPTRNKHTRIVHPDTLLKGALSYLDSVPTLSFYDDRCQAGKFRDGLLIAFLVCRPIRLANVTNIIIGQQMIEDDSRWQFAFAANEMKDNNSLEFSLPELLNPYLETYLDTYRQVLLKGNDGNNLWISSRGKPMSEQSVYWNTCQLTEDLFGQRINPHLFRDCAASALATDDPEHILAIARILGHASIKTSNRHYNQSQMTAAGKILSEVIAELRDRPEPTPHREHL